MNVNTEGLPQGEISGNTQEQKEQIRLVCQAGEPTGKVLHVEPYKIR